jgi:hypothetical protein
MGKDGGVTFYFILPLEISIPILSIKKDRITSRADPTGHIRTCGKFGYPAQSFVPRLKFRLAPVLHFHISVPFASLCFVLCCFVGGTSWQRCTITHAILARRRDSPRQKWRKSDHDGERPEALPEV